MYPELLTRHDLKVFLPPIGGMTVYIVSFNSLIASRLGVVVNESLSSTVR